MGISRCIPSQSWQYGTIGRGDFIDVGMCCDYVMLLRTTTTIFNWTFSPLVMSMMLLPGVRKAF